MSLLLSGILNLKETAEYICIGTNISVCYSRKRLKIATLCFQVKTSKEISKLNCEEQPLTKHLENSIVLGQTFPLL